MLDKEAATVACLLVNEFICWVGIPEVLHTDQEKNFESTLIAEMCHLLGIKKTRTTSYHPQSDRLVERLNRTHLTMLSIAATECEQEWDLRLPVVMLAYRSSMQETTGATPFSLMFEREVHLPIDLMFNTPSDHPPPSCINQWMYTDSVGVFTGAKKLCSRINTQRPNNYARRSYVTKELVAIHTCLTIMFGTTLSCCSKGWGTKVSSTMKYKHLWRGSNVTSTISECDSCLWQYIHGVWLMFVEITPVI